jgi:hypothetical protein
MNFSSPDNYQSDLDSFAPPNFGGTLAVKTATIAYTDTTAKALFTLPYGAKIVDFYVEIVTGFTDTGTDVIDVGTAANDDEYVDAMNVTTPAVVRYGAAGTVLGSALESLTADEVIYGVYTGQNGNAGAGLANIIFAYILYTP